MRIGIIGPSSLKRLKKRYSNAEEILSNAIKLIAEKGHERLITPDNGSVSEFFAKKYLKHNGKRVFNLILGDDKEFGLDWMNLEIGEKINCGTWRNQPENFNEESDISLCCGWAVGVLAEIAYSKLFKPKKVFIIKELVKEELPREINESLDIEYFSYKDLKI